MNMDTVCFRGLDKWSSPDGTDSGESNLSGPFLLEEEIPENLGSEWRVLHPFEIPGVRFPTDTTPPNKRRLVENDTLVELIKTTEYLEDMPMWGQRDYQFYPPRYGDLFIEEEEWAEEEVEEGESGWVRYHLKEIQSEGLGEVEWSSPVSDGRAGRDIPVSSPTIQESQQRTPPTPAPSDDRILMDWSSIRTGSPLVRMPPQSISVRERGWEINQISIQTSQPSSEPTCMGVTENALQEDLPSTTPLAK